jgi:hypothetical protein
MDKKKEYVGWVDNYAGNYSINFGKVKNETKTMFIFEKDNSYPLVYQSRITKSNIVFVWLTKEEVITLHKKYRELHKEFEKKITGYKLELTSLLSQKQNH